MNYGMCIKTHADNDLEYSLLIAYRCQYLLVIIIRELYNIFIRLHN